MKFKRLPQVLALVTVGAIAACSSSLPTRAAHKDEKSTVLQSMALKKTI